MENKEEKEQNLFIKYYKMYMLKEQMGTLEKHDGTST